MRVVSVFSLNSVKRTITVTIINSLCSHIVLLYINDPVRLQTCVMLILFQINPGVCVLLSTLYFFVNTNVILTDHISQFHYLLTSQIIKKSSFLYTQFLHSEYIYWLLCVRFELFVCCDHSGSASVKKAT